MDSQRKIPPILVLLSLFSVTTSISCDSPISSEGVPEPPKLAWTNPAPIPNNPLFEVVFIGREEKRLLISTQTRYEGGVNPDRAIYYKHEVMVRKFDKMKEGGLLVQRNVDYYLTRPDAPNKKVSFKIDLTDQSIKTGIVTVEFNDSVRGLSVGKLITSFADLHRLSKNS